MSAYLPPSPYKRKIWDYKTAKTDLICADLWRVNWHELFHNLNVSEGGLLFTDISLDTVAKHIWNKIITCNDKDAPWITPEVKTSINRNSRVNRKWVNTGRNPNDEVKVRHACNSTNKLIKEAKLAYYTNLANKLSNP